VQLRSDCNLDDTIASFTEDLIRLIDLIEAESVRQERGQVQALLPNQFHQPAHALFASRAKRCDNFVISQTSGKGLDRQREFSRVHPQAGERSTQSLAAKWKRTRRLLAGK